MNDKCIDVPFAGKFKRVSSTEGEQSVCFMAALDLLGAGRFNFPENFFNVSPVSKTALRFHNSESLSLSAISASAEVTREEAASVLKQIFT